MADEIEYKLDNVPATSIASKDIDKTFRSTCIGERNSPDVHSSSSSSSSL